MDRLTVRDVERGELAELADLCREHAEFDRGLDEPVQPLPDDLAERLEEQIFGPRPGIWCLVAVAGGALAGYASYCWHPSTWRGDSYVLLDCLFVRDGVRGQAVGRRLFDAGVRRARELGATRLQWQTPRQNHAGQRFYERTGAHGVDKLRYTLSL
ncbi:GNAT family N-acetyltransferase [Amycolatopsis acidiphila]|uniref:GNAT family N-acetyltransferase n=1 Tax=Amycolatopsis acidiphila TaxID=715473 RepID=A0A557ZVM5_9PSEU|nr:GNAT family N-acetyltransferase [Amycolatopsis acidiphila]TVT16062.1 GNAT family N-acetyltransferase [Amycolatopsis acidiphila]UIJ62276.1 GNAT family N-acetyltransferase [Amycolatopsis acidiphila]GHG93073.1 N-acetyltransferase [Amycolatopsis acidiphila]